MKTVFVVVSEFVQQYGGPEEGGWYYNQPSTVEVLRVKKKDAAAVRAKLAEEYEKEAAMWRPRYRAPAFGVQVYSKPKFFPENVFRTPHYE